MRTTLTATAAGLTALIAAAAIITVGSGKGGCGAVCCMRPEGATIDMCMRRNPRTGDVEDYGAGNAMPGTHAVGVGCVPTECVLGQGVEMLDAGAP